MIHFKHCDYIAASQGFVHVPAMDTSSVGRCVFFLILALVFDVVGLILFFLGIFAPWSFWDFFVLSGPLLIFLSLVFWIFWYLGSLTVPYEELILPNPPGRAAAPVSTVLPTCCFQLSRDSRSSRDTLNNRL
uniref:Transmembrane protein 238 like n=1 Tax=Hucho hucho TaxID=62062 RepID=A0A4W5N2G9_9TELE